MFLLCLFTKIVKMVPLGRTKWLPELKIDKKQALQDPVGASQGLLSLLAHHRVFFSCWCFKWSSVPAGVLHISYFKTNKMVAFNRHISSHDTITSTSCLFSYYASLQKIAMKSCKQDISKNYFSYCIET